MAEQSWKALQAFYLKVKNFMQKHRLSNQTYFYLINKIHNN